MEDRYTLVLSNNVTEKPIFIVSIDFVLFCILYSFPDLVIRLREHLFVWPLFSLQDSVTAVPYSDFNDNLMKPQPIDLSREFVDKCRKSILEEP